MQQVRPNRNGPEREERTREDEEVRRTEEEISGGDIESAYEIRQKVNEGLRRILTSYITNEVSGENLPGPLTIAVTKRTKVAKIVFRSNPADSGFAFILILLFWARFL